MVSDYFRRLHTSRIVKLLASTLIAVPSVVIAAQPADRNLPIDLEGDMPAYRSDHLQLGGQNAAGASIAVNQYYVTLNGSPTVMVSGEFHYYRYPRKYWKEELLKMKAAGINTVATFSHWIVHEEREGIFDWSGDRDLRAFIDLCKQLNMKVSLRIGPYGHGEIRNGGFPDWLMGRGVTVRSNDPEYLRYVSRFFQQIGQQVKGQLFKDGGPVIGVQIECEYQHSASPWALSYSGQALDWTMAPDDRGIMRTQLGTAVGENKHSESGIAHMRQLKAAAIEAGIDVPLWTVSGWGNATMIPSETLPVQAAYAYPSWEAKGEPSSLYIYKNLQQEPDYAPVSYKSTDYPYILAELGPGMINNYSRRPTVPSQSIDALVNRGLGSGANGIGYYMFQNGTTPRGERSYLADEAFGYPHMSYDFGGGLGEFGDARPDFYRLKLIHYFLDAFGDRLAPMPLVLPAGASSIKPTDLETVRYSARGANGSGFLFVNNFQDHVTNKAKDARFDIHTPTGKLSLPLEGMLHIPAEENMILPVNFDMGGVKLVSATVQPLTRLDDGERQHFIFFGREGMARQFVFGSDVVVRAGAREGCAVRRTDSLQIVDCAPADVARFEVQSQGLSRWVVLLDHKTALHSWLMGQGRRRHLIISEAMPLDDNGQIAFRSIGANSVAFQAYPALSASPAVVGAGMIKPLSKRRGFSSYMLSQRAFEPSVRTAWPAGNKLTVDLPPADLPAGVVDVWIKLPYEADTVMAFVGGEMVADQFYNGRPWLIGTKRFLGRDKQILFNFRPLTEKLPYYADLPNGGPTIDKNQYVIRAQNVTMTPEYQIVIRF